MLFTFVQIGSGARKNYCKIGTGVRSRGKSAEAWRWLPKTTYGWGYEWVEIYLYSPLCHSMGCYGTTFIFTRLHVVIIIKEVPFLLSFFLSFLFWPLSRRPLCRCTGLLLHLFLFNGTHSAGDRPVHGTVTCRVWYQMLYNTILTSWWWSHSPRNI